MNLDRKEINWNSDMLIQLIKNMEVPLASIIEASNKPSKLLEKKPNNIIISNSQEIANLMEDIMQLAGANKDRVPLIYKIYHANDKVQSMCNGKINIDRISKQDALWLLDLEDEVNKKISHKDLNLYDLSYKMAVSERQLFRKIKNLLHLTPNKYIRILKLHKAKELIDSYIYNTVSEVSYAVGYNDSHYFSKLFSLQYGMSPKKLLKMTGC